MLFGVVRERGRMCQLTTRRRQDPGRTKATQPPSVIDSISLFLEDEGLSTLERRTTAGLKHFLGISPNHPPIALRSCSLFNAFISTERVVLPCLMDCQKTLRQSQGGRRRDIVAYRRHGSLAPVSNNVDSALGENLDMQCGLRL